MARESGNLKGLVLGYINAIFTRENKKAGRRARTETGQRNTERTKGRQRHKERRQAEKTQRRQKGRTLLVILDKLKIKYLKVITDLVKKSVMERT